MDAEPTGRNRDSPEIGEPRQRPADEDEQVLADPAVAHRSTAADLLVSGLRPAGEDVWSVEVILPRSHWLCHPIPDTIPLLLFVEAFRQAGIAVCTAGMHMEPSIHFVISKLSIDLAEPIPFPRFGAAEFTAVVSFLDVTYRKGVPDRLEVDFAIGDTVRAHFSARALRDVDYRVVRRSAAALGAEILERHENLLRELARGPQSLDAILGVNEADPFFFDHAVDHIPGTLLLHAATTLHTLGLGEPATGADVAFPSFAELRTRTDLHTLLEPAATHTVVTQEGRVVAEAHAYRKEPHASL